MSTQAATSNQYDPNASLYERLGQRPRIEEIVEAIWINHTSNPLIKQRYVNSDPERVKLMVTEMCCAGFRWPGAVHRKGHGYGAHWNEHQRNGIHCRM